MKSGRGKDEDKAEAAEVSGAELQIQSVITKPKTHCPAREPSK